MQPALEPQLVLRDLAHFDWNFVGEDLVLRRALDVKPRMAVHLNSAMRLLSSSKNQIRRSPVLTLAAWTEMVVSTLRQVLYFKGAATKIWLLLSPGIDMTERYRPIVFSVYTDLR